jgi:hypothetical protein
MLPYDGYSGEDDDESDNGVSGYEMRLRDSIQNDCLKAGYGGNSCGM